jgi:hypothetical protein
MSQLYRHLTGTDFCDHILDLHLGGEPVLPEVPRRRTVAARRIMPAADSVLAGRVELGWLDDPALGVVGFEDFRLSSGGPVHRQDVLGRVAVVDEDPASAARRADHLVAQFEERLGFRLLRSAPPVTAARER